MDFFVGVTDNKWYARLAGLKPDEVNFWNPGGVPFKAIAEGSLFLFKLHSPLNFIVGGGYFVRWLKLPLSLAWEAFQEKNGAENRSQFLEMINRIRARDEKDPEIGCTLLTAPFFFEKTDWIKTPQDWSSNIVRGKTYSTREVHGRLLWSEVNRLITGRKTITGSLAEVEDENKYEIERRLGQGAFRALVTENYNRRCAISGERTLPVLEAAHIKPYSMSKQNEPDNGVLLRCDIHALFDKGYMTITPDYHIRVSKQIKEQFNNGKIYYEFSDKKLKILPESKKEQPSRELLDWHNREIFQG